MTLLSHTIDQNLAHTHTHTHTHTHSGCHRGSGQVVHHHRSCSPYRGSVPADTHGVLGLPALTAKSQLRFMGTGIPDGFLRNICCSAGLEGARTFWKICSE